MIYQIYIFKDFSGADRQLFSESQDLDENNAKIWYESWKSRVPEGFGHTIIDQNNAWFVPFAPDVPTVEEVVIPQKDQLRWEDISEIVKKRQIDAARERVARQEALDEYIANFPG